MTRKRIDLGSPQYHSCKRQQRAFAIADPKIVSEPYQSLVHQFQCTARLRGGKTVGVGTVPVNALQGQLSKRSHILDNRGRGSAADLQQPRVALLADHERVAGPLDDLVVGGGRFLDQQCGVAAIFQAATRLAQLIIYFDLRLDSWRGMCTHRRHGHRSRMDQGDCGSIRSARTRDCAGRFWFRRSRASASSPDGLWCKPGLVLGVPCPGEPIFDGSIGNFVAICASSSPGTLYFSMTRSSLSGSFGIPVWRQVCGIQDVEENAALKHAHQDSR